MNHNRRQTWWDLHLRAARGESLTAEQRTAYEAGLRQLEQDEDLQLNALRFQREALAKLEAEQRRLLKQRADLNADIATLEAMLDNRSRQLLGGQRDEAI